MQGTYKEHIIEMYAEKVCSFYKITEEQFFTRYQEPGYNKKFNFVRGMFMYLCSLRKIPQKEIISFLQDNGLPYSQNNLAMHLTRTKLKILNDKDLLELVERLR